MVYWLRMKRILVHIYTQTQTAMHRMPQEQEDVRAGERRRRKGANKRESDASSPRARYAVSGKLQHALVGSCTILQLLAYIVVVVVVGRCALECSVIKTNRHIPLP